MAMHGEVLAGEATKVEIGEDVAKQNQAAISVGFEHIKRVPRPTQFGPQMDVRQDESAVRCASHALKMRYS